MTVTWVWSGAVTDDGARVRASVTGASQRLLVADNDAMSGGTFYNSTSLDATGVATFDPTGLAPATQYWYQVEDDSVVDTSTTGRLRTAGPVGQPETVTFGVGSCAGLGTPYPGAGGLAPSRISNHPVFDEVRVFDPDFFMHLGDRNYYDLGSGKHGIVGGGSLANYRAAYDDVLTQCPRQAALYLNVPLVDVWDDHCYGPNNSDGTLVDKANGAQVYRERSPHYPLVEASGSIYHSFQRGRVLFVMLDSRYNRDAPDAPSPRTYLGSAQKTWLNDLLTTPPAGADFLVVGTPQPFMSNGSTSWGSYTEERAELYQMFGDTGWIGNMFALAGDQHQFGWDSGANTAGFPLYTMGPLDSNAGVSGRAYDLGTRAERGQWGLIEIRDYGNAFRVRVQGMLTLV